MSSPPALLVVDIQGGTLGRSFAPRSAEDCLTAALKLAGKVRDTGGVVVVTRSAFAPDLADVPPGPVDKRMPILSSGRPPDWDNLPHALSAIADMIVERPHWNAFHGTDLDNALRLHSVRDLIFVGLTTNFSIESTARDGWERGYAQWFAADAMASISDETHRFALETTLPRLGRVRNCAVLSRLLAPARPDPLP